MTRLNVLLLALHAYIGWRLSPSGRVRVLLS